MQPAPRASVAFDRSSLRIVREVPDSPLHPSPMVLRTSDSVRRRASHVFANPHRKTGRPPYWQNRWERCSVDLRNSAKRCSIGTSGVCEDARIVGVQRRDSSCQGVTRDQILAWDERSVWIRLNPFATGQPNGSLRRYLAVHGRSYERRMSTRSRPSLTRVRVTRTLASRRERDEARSTGGSEWRGALLGWL